MSNITDFKVLLITILNSVHFCLAFTVVDHIAWSSTHSLKKYREHRREWVK